MNKFKSLMLLAILMVSAVLTSCSDDDDSNTPASYSAGSLATSSQLMSILKNDGYSFDDQGHLLLDYKALNTTSLDLSSTKLDTAELKNLSILPNLTDVNLANNGYEMSFNFSSLPTQITSVNLTGNELYEFPGLVNIVTAENGDETITVLRNLAKLSLPEGAKYNCDELPAFYANSSNTDLEMADANGNLKKYTTLRGVPDDSIRGILKEQFPSIFVGDSIDISKHLTGTEATNAIPFYNTVQRFSRSVEGFEYIVMNPGYKGTSVFAQSDAKEEIEYLKIDSTVSQIGLSSVKHLNLNSATNLTYAFINDNPYIKELDLSHSTKFAQRSYNAEINIFSPGYLYVYNCANIESIKLPSRAHLLASVLMYSNPKLKTLDLSQFDGIMQLRLANLPNTNITYPNPTIFNYAGKMNFGCTEDVYNKPETKAFLDKYHDKLTEDLSLLLEGFQPYEWSHDYE